LFIDGEEVGTTPFEATELEAADYVLRLELDGYDAAEHLMTVIAGEVASTELPALRPEAADLYIVSTPEGISFELRSLGTSEAGAEAVEASVFEPVRGMTPANLTDLPLGSYEIVYQRDGWPELREEVALERSRDEVEAVLEFPSGALVVMSEPAGAEVYRD